MIRLEIEKYCEDCSEFEPMVDKDDFEIYDRFLHQHVNRADTQIFCKHKKRCEKMIEFLRAWMKEENK